MLWKKKKGINVKSFFSNNQLIRMYMYNSLQEPNIMSEISNSRCNDFLQTINGSVFVSESPEANLILIWESLWSTATIWGSSSASQCELPFKNLSSARWILDKAGNVLDEYLRSTSRVNVQWLALVFKINVVYFIFTPFCWFQLRYLRRRPLHFGDWFPALLAHICCCDQRAAW